MNDAGFIPTYPMFLILLASSTAEEASFHVIETENDRDGVAMFSEMLFLERHVKDNGLLGSGAASIDTPEKLTGLLKMLLGHDFQYVIVDAGRIPSHLRSVVDIEQLLEDLESDSWE